MGSEAQSGVAGNRAPARSGERVASRTDETARALRARWDALLLAERDGNVDAMGRLKRIWSTRGSWPDGAVRCIASLYDANPATWERVAAFLDRD